MPEPLYRTDRKRAENTFYTEFPECGHSYRYSIEKAEVEHIMNSGSLADTLVKIADNLHRTEHPECFE